MKKLIIVITAVIALVLPQFAHAELNTDIRVKLGSAPGATKYEVGGLSTDLSRDGGGNFQAEVAFSPVQENPIGYVFGVGLFGRTHKGNDNSVPQTHVEYDAAGLSLTGGIGYKASPGFHFEGKGGLDLGSGKPKFSTPSQPIDSGGYSALSLILGGYYTVSKPGFQIGLELGAQTWRGNFRMQNGFGQWIDSYVRGDGGFANLVVGVRF